MHPHHNTSSQSLNLSAVDFDQTPFVAIWETTKTCQLACRHCRAEAITTRDPRELTTAEGFRLLEQLAAMGTPICVLSGGDPAMRDDLSHLVCHGSRLGMRMATIPAATTLLTRQLVRKLKDAGLAQMALSLDGPNAEVHDTFRNTPGAFALTLQGAQYAAEERLPLQINTTFSGSNWNLFDEISQLVKSLNVVFWEVFFLVPMGRGRELGQMNADQFEDLFQKLSNFGRTVDFIVKVTEAPHYRRFLMQNHPSRRAADVSNPSGALHSSTAAPDSHRRGHLPAHMRRDFGPGGSIGLAPKGVNSGNGHLFVSHIGEVYPSGFLPLSCGNIRRDSVADIYRNHPVFRELRSPELLKGKCGICEFKNICAGSRARAYAMTGDYLAEEPFCVYEPKLRPANRHPQGQLLTG
ncbi:MAG: TIGR04053 family radical SAM/SPASM domain-containing protein [Acidobacteria bacterium]|nr:TIGR04053 family radical SAM/SPASM domain-containing protein [Acidobacteriota bacterium]